MNKVAILMLLPIVAIGILGACTNEAEAPDSERIANASTSGSVAFTDAEYDGTNGDGDSDRSDRDSG